MVEGPKFCGTTMEELTCYLESYGLDASSKSKGTGDEWTAYESMRFNSFKLTFFLSLQKIVE